jgi:hypothetical protein
MIFKGKEVTKNDITSLRIELADIKSELNLMMWLVAIIVAGVISLIVKSFF